jgi:hypothetical protein
MNRCNSDLILFYYISRLYLDVYISPIVAVLKELLFPEIFVFASPGRAPKGCSASKLNPPDDHERNHGHDGVEQNVIIWAFPLVKAFFSFLFFSLLLQYSYSLHPITYQP